MSIPKDTSNDKLGAVHHYVPQGYLKRFGIASSRSHVFAYEVDKDPYKVNVHNVAGQRDFYTIEGDDGKQNSALEDAFADIDAAGLKIIQKLDTSPLGFVKLSNKDKGDLLTYTAFQHTRNLQERKNHANMHNLMMSRILELYAHDEQGWHNTAKENPDMKYDYDEVEQSRQKVMQGKAKLRHDPNDQYFLRSALEINRTLYEILFVHKTMVIVEAMEETSGFITSDNPVTHYLLEEQKKALQFPFNGLGYINAVFQFPVSPTRCLLFMNSDMEIDTFEYDQEAVDYINYYTYFYADRWVFANENLEKFKDEFKIAHNTEPLWKMS